VLPVNHRQHVDTFGTLTLDAVNRLSDEGWYTCDARDSSGQGMSRSVYVSVNGLLQFAVIMSLTEHNEKFKANCDMAVKFKNNLK